MKWIKLFETFDIGGEPYEDGWFMVMSDHAVYLCDQLSGVEKLFRDKYLQYYKSKF